MGEDVGEMAELLGGGTFWLPASGRARRQFAVPANATCRSTARVRLVDGQIDDLGGRTGVRPLPEAYQHQLSHGGSLRRRRDRRSLPGRRWGAFAGTLPKRCPVEASRISGRRFWYHVAESLTVSPSSRTSGSEGVGLPGLLETVLYRGRRDNGGRLGIVVIRAARGQDIDNATAGCASEVRGGRRGSRPGIADLPGGV